MRACMHVCVYVWAICVCADGLFARDQAKGSREHCITEGEGKKEKKNSHGSVDSSSRTGGEEMRLEGQERTMNEEAVKE